MSNSTLVSYTKLSPNHSGKRTHSIDRITPHCVVGQLSVESICSIFLPVSRKASCNYCIGTDGRIALNVDEEKRSWCSSSRANDQRAVTIECASDLKAPYAMNSSVYQSLINLCIDICRRNGKTKLLWFADKNKSLNYEPKIDEMVLTVHRWFSSTECPGDWLYNRLGDVAAQVTNALSGSTTVPFMVKVEIADLNIRTGPGTNYARTGKYTGKGVFSVTEVRTGKGSTAGWGKLKSGAGWISLDFCKRV